MKLHVWKAQVQIPTGHPPALGAYSQHRLLAQPAGPDPAAPERWEKSCRAQKVPAGLLSSCCGAAGAPCWGCLAMRVCSAGRAWETREKNAKILCRNSKCEANTWARQCSATPGETPWSRFRLGPHKAQPSHDFSHSKDRIYISMLWVPVTLGKVCTEAFEEHCLQNLCASTAIQMLVVCEGRARGHRGDYISVCGTCG